jgi:hypothetical protein
MLLLGDIRTQPLVQEVTMIANNTPGPQKHRVPRRLALLAGLAATALLLLPSPRYGNGPKALAHPYTLPNGNSVHLHIDADITNGTRPCDPIDETATVAVGSVHKAGVCIEDYVPNFINNLELHILYTGDPSATPPTTLNSATELPDVAPALDDNPDANDGAGADKLGTGWDCTGLGVKYPVGEDPYTPGVADAFIVCNADLVNPDQELAADPGLLATVEFTATAAGVDTIDFGPIDSTNGNLVVFLPTDQEEANIYRCGTVIPEEQMGCFGATIQVVTCPPAPNFDGDLPPFGNGSAGIDNSPGIPGDDGTVAMSDALCDVADPDDDNDGLPDAQDTNPLGATGICAAFAGASDGHPNPAGGDSTNDDNHNGNPAPPMGTDAADNGPSWDSDNDGVPDGVECALGHNPRTGADRPTTTQCGGTGDTDGDGLRNAWETCGWGTNPAVVDSDGDGRGDCTEAADVDGNGIVDYGGDALDYVRAATLPPASFGKTMDFDIDKNGIVDYGGDALTVVRFALKIWPCQ